MNDFFQCKYSTAFKIERWSVSRPLGITTFLGYSPVPLRELLRSPWRRSSPSRTCIVSWWYFRDRASTTLETSRNSCPSGIAGPRSDCDFYPVFFDRTHDGAKPVYVVGEGKKLLSVFFGEKRKFDPKPSNCEKKKETFSFLYGIRFYCCCLFTIAKSPPFNLLEIVFGENLGDILNGDNRGKFPPCPPPPPNAMLFVLLLMLCVCASPPRFSVLMIFWWILSRVMYT